MEPFDVVEDVGSCFCAGLISLPIDASRAWSREPAGSKEREFICDDESSPHAGADADADLSLIHN